LLLLLLDTSWFWDVLNLIQNNILWLIFLLLLSYYLANNQWTDELYKLARPLPYPLILTLQFLITPLSLSLTHSLTHAHFTPTIFLVWMDWSSSSTINKILISFFSLSLYVFFYFIFICSVIIFVWFIFLIHKCSVYAVCLWMNAKSWLRLKKKHRTVFMCMYKK